MIRNETFPLTVEPLDARWKVRFWAMRVLPVGWALGIDDITAPLGVVPRLGLEDSDVFHAV